MPCYATVNTNEVVLTCDDCDIFIGVRIVETGKLLATVQKCPRHSITDSAVPTPSDQLAA